MGAVSSILCVSFMSLYCFDTHILLIIWGLWVNVPVEDEEQWAGLQTGTEATHGYAQERKYSETSHPSPHPGSR